MLVLEVQQHRNIVFARDVGDQMDGFRVAVHRELLLADADRAHLEILLDHLSRFRNVRQLVGENNVLVGVAFRQLPNDVVPARIGRQAVAATRREQHRS